MIFLHHKEIQLKETTVKRFFLFENVIFTIYQETRKPSNNNSITFQSELSNKTAVESKTSTVWCV